MKKQETIDAIVQAARPATPDIVPSIELSGSDGGWYGLIGFPTGVTYTGEKKIVGWVFRRKDDGCTYGKRYESETAAREAWDAYVSRQDGKFRADLQGMTLDGLAEQAAHWLKTA